MKRHFLWLSFAVDDPFVDVLFYEEVCFEDGSRDDGGGGLAVDRQDFHGWSRGDPSGEGGSPWGEPFGRQLRQAVFRNQDVFSGCGGREDDAAVLHDDERRFASGRRERRRRESGGNAAERGWIIGLEPDDAVWVMMFQIL